MHLVATMTIVMCRSFVSTNGSNAVVYKVAFGLLLNVTTVNMTRNRVNSFSTKFQSLLGSI